jgi:hypothetical protein
MLMKAIQQAIHWATQQQNLEAALFVVITMFVSGGTAVVCMPGLLA